MSIAEKIERQLRETEAELRTLLHRVLPLCAERGTLIFFNCENLPDDYHAHWLPPESDELLRLAKLCARLRKQVGLRVEGTADQLFMKACAESSDMSNPHRRGPRKLAAWLLGELENASPSRTV